MPAAASVGSVTPNIKYFLNSSFSRKNHRNNGVSIICSHSIEKWLVFMMGIPDFQNGFRQLYHLQINNDQSLRSNSLMISPIICFLTPSGLIKTTVFSIIWLIIVPVFHLFLFHTTAKLRVLGQYIFYHTIYFSFRHGFNPFHIVSKRHDGLVIYFLTAIPFVHKLRVFRTKCYHGFQTFYRNCNLFVCNPFSTTFASSPIIPCTAQILFPWQRQRK